jgi:predicted ATPase with chaperone activity
VCRRVVATIKSCTLVGIDAKLVDVECTIDRDLPQYSVVGLAAPSVKEGATRIRAGPGEPSAQIRERVAAARDRQLARLRTWNLRCNAEMPSDLFRGNGRLATELLRTCAGIAVDHARVGLESIDLSQVAPTACA